MNIDIHKDITVEIDEDGFPLNYRGEVILPYYHGSAALSALKWFEYNVKKLQQVIE